MSVPRAAIVVGGIAGAIAIAVLVVVAVPVVTIWPLLVLAGLAVLAPFGVAAVRGRIDLFEPVYLFAFTYALLFVVRPVVDLVTHGGTPRVLGYSTEPTYQLTLLVGLVGLMAFYAGYYSRAGTRVAEALPVPTAPLTTSLLSRATAVTVVWSVALFTLYLVVGGGGTALRLLLNARSVEGQQFLQDSSGYLYDGLVWLTGPALLVLATTPRWRSARGLVGMALLLLSQIINIANGNRSWTLPVACALLLLWYLRRGSRPSVQVVAVFAAVAFVLGVVAPGQYRNVQGQTGTLTVLADSVTHPADGLGTFLTGADTAMVDDLAVELQVVPSLADHRLGSTYVDDLLIAVPRAIWPDKPVDGDTQLMTVIWPVSARAGVGLSFSLFGEPYLNFGILGVAMVCAALGATWRALYAWVSRAGTNPVAITVFALSWPYLFVYLRGSLGTGYPRQVIMLAPVVAIALVAALRSRSVSRELATWRPREQPGGPT